MAHLLLCQHCTRYFKHLEPACPFCATAPLTREPPAALVLPKRASRSAIHAARMAMLASATTFVACTDSGASGTELSSEAGEHTGTCDAASCVPATDSTSEQGESSETPIDSDAADHSSTDSGDSTGDVDDTPGDDVPSTSDDAGDDDTEATASTTDGDTPETDDAAVVTGMGGKACAGYQEQDPAIVTTCRSNADCDPSYVCATAPVLIYPDRNPCQFMMQDCSPVTCDGECQTDPSGCLTCVPVCSELNCSGVSECVDNQCLLKLCDTEGAQECGEGYVCAPDETSASNHGCALIPCDQNGTLGCSPQQRCAPDEEGADVLGCVTLTCAEGGGQACQQYFECDPESPEANYLGCAPLPCSQPGSVACPADSVCRPDAPNAQQTGIYAGCSTILCDEAGGPACPDEYTCSSGADTASSIGCIPTSCLADWSCDPWRVCNPDDPVADVHGCSNQPCTIDTDCGCGFCFNEVCSPVEPTCHLPEIVATPYGCVWPDDEFV